jgi:hypothetical protein
MNVKKNKNGAGDGIRTHDNDVGNVVLYQLSYTRPAVEFDLATRIEAIWNENSGSAR